MPHPSAPFAIHVCGIEELEGHCATGASHVLSILDPDHPVPEAFGAFGEHRKLELRFHDDVDVRPERVPPTQADVDRVLAFGREIAATPGAALLVHCHAGISRSTACMVLVLAQALPEVPAAAVLEMVHGIREKAWPNLLIMEMGDAALGRDGALVAATHVLHGLQLQKRPRLREYMTGLGREREIASAVSPDEVGPL